jgi:Na+/H+-translocating membrane pyrophosphatase
MTALWVIVLCGALSIVYAIWATSSVLKADAGNARMQEIAEAVREGAQAYLKRQYSPSHRRRRDLRAAGLLPRHAGSRSAS